MLLATQSESDIPVLLDPSTTHLLTVHWRSARRALVGFQSLCSPTAYFPKMVVDHEYLTSPQAMTPVDFVQVAAGLYERLLTTMSAQGHCVELMGLNADPVDGGGYQVMCIIPDAFYCTMGVYLDGSVSMTLAVINAAGVETNIMAYTAIAWRHELADLGCIADGDRVHVTSTLAYAQQEMVALLENRLYDGGACH